jgi:tetratricopeptide (TPR) repeat protein
MEPGTQHRAAWLAGVLAAAGAAFAACGARDEAPPGAAEPAPVELSEAAFVGSDACAECHPEEHTLWRGSHHDRAMEPANEATVLGDFDDARFTHLGVTTRFFRRDGRFFFNTEGPDGQLADFEVAYTFGVEPLQQYLIAFPGGRLQSFTVAWDTQAGRWFHLYPEEQIAAGDPLHWTGLYLSWNTMCAECHSTGLHKGYDAKRDDFATSWAEIDVGCETCHGPGEAHASWAKTLPEGVKPEDGATGLLVNFAAGDARYEVEGCAPCHSRRGRLSSEERLPRPFLDHFVPVTLREGLYHANGQIQEEVYVYGSFLQSRMYRAGVRCGDCHDPHSLRLWAPGNALCARCHWEHPDPRFPSLVAKRYDTPEHHFHPADSPSASCVACHMPVRTYMVVDPRHDHSLRIPRPDLSARLGTPNTCNDCHADRSADWAAEAVATWYGPERRQEPRFAEAFAAGRRGAPEAGPALAALVADPDQPGIVRATALELLRAQGPEAAAVLVAATRDRDPLVRAAAVGGLDSLPPEPRLEAAAPLLEDPLRLVRVEAARVLASLPAERFPPRQRRVFEAALVEYEEAQRAQADLPSAHLNLGALRASMGDRDLAERSYRKALSLDPGFLPARANLAHLYNQMGRNRDAERVLREGIARVSEAGELHYSLGLLLAEEGRLEEAAEALGAAVVRLPDRARVRYNRGLALQRLGRQVEAEAALLAARQLDRRDPAIANALAILYAQQQRWEKALPFAEELVKLAPEAPGPRQLLWRIRQELSASADSG